MPTLTASVVGGGAGGGLSLAAIQASECFDLKAACDLKPEVCEKLRGTRTWRSKRNAWRLTRVMHDINFAIGGGSEPRISIVNYGNDISDCHCLGGYL